MKPGRRRVDRPVLLDTHVWVWLMEGRIGVRPEAVELMERAGEESFLRLPESSTETRLIDSSWQRPESWGRFC